MGIAAVLSLVVGVASTISQVNAQKKAQIADDRANQISDNQQAYKDILTRRSLMKQERIRRARIKTSAAATGVVGSSGELGALASLTSNVGAGIASQQADILAVAGINQAAKDKASALGEAQRTALFGKLLQKGIGIADDAGLFGG